MWPKTGDLTFESRGNFRLDRNQDSQRACRAPALREDGPEALFRCGPAPSLTLGMFQGHKFPQTFDHGQVQARKPGLEC